MAEEVEGGSAEPIVVEEFGRMSDEKDRNGRGQSRVRQKQSVYLMGQTRESV